MMTTVRMAAQSNLFSFADRIVRYAIVGILGTCIYIALLALLVDVLGQHPVPSSILAFIATVVEGYVLNYFWTFRSSEDHGYALLRFVIVSCTGLLLNTGIMHFCVAVLGWTYVWGAFSVIVIVPVSNFLLNAYWTFADRRGEPREGAGRNEIMPSSKQ